MYAHQAPSRAIRLAASCSKCGRPRSSATTRTSGRLIGSECRGQLRLWNEPGPSTGVYVAGASRTFSTTLRRGTLNKGSSGRSRRRIHLSVANDELAYDENGSSEAASEGTSKRNVVEGPSSPRASPPLQQHSTLSPQPIRLAHPSDPDSAKNWTASAVGPPAAVEESNNPSPEPPPSSLRPPLETLPEHAFINHTSLFDHLFPDYVFPPLNELSDTDVETILSHCIAQQRGLLAGELILQVAESGLQVDPQLRREFSQDSLTAAFKLSAGAALASEVSSANRILDTLLSLLRVLQDLRHPRSLDIYQPLIKVCLHLDRPDTAAEIYVGMVEEWIMEGRLAAGALSEHFHDGGGPPEKGREELELRSDLLKSWWKGIRSWALPGEVLSPHGRLDLWHPRKLHLGEKLRRFPFPTPTSPPTLVPAPKEHLLIMILDRLQLDPHEASRTDFTKSMRACAILANTIHSRTLPFMSKGLLIEALQRTPFTPKVYPESVDVSSIPKRDEWAYTAYTHIHLALQSLNWEPPPSEQDLKLVRERATEQDGAVEARSTTAPSALPIYRMGPLSIPACRALIKYGSRKLQSYSSTLPLLKYLTTNFHPENLTRVLTDIFRTAVDNASVEHLKQVKDVVFSTPDAKEVAKESEVSPELAPTVLTAVQNNEFATDDMEIFSSVFGIPAPTSDWRDIASDLDANSERFIALARYFVRRRQSHHVDLLVYRILPHLNPDATAQAEKPRPWNRHYPRPRVYKVLIWALGMFHHTSLAQLVFHDAMKAEEHWRYRYGNYGKLRDEYRTLRQTYSYMILLWRDEYVSAERYVRHCETSGRINHDSRLYRRRRYGSFRRQWNHNIGRRSAPAYIEALPRAEASAKMMLHIYSLARTAWLTAAQDPLTGAIYPERAGRVAPDAIFAEIVTRCLGVRWGIDIRSKKLCDIWGYPSEPLQDIHRREIEKFIEDMDMFDVPVPPILRYRLMTPEELEAEPAAAYTKPDDHIRTEMRAIMNHRREEDLLGRKMLKLSLEKFRWRGRDVAADLWQWSSEGGGQMSQSTMSKMVSKEGRSPLLIKSGERYVLSERFQRAGSRPTKVGLLSTEQSPQEGQVHAYNS